MRNHLLKLLLVAGLLASAALGGVLAGQTYSAWVLGHAQAGDPTAAVPGVPPAWDQMHILYFGPDPATDERVAYLADTLQTVGALRMTSWADTALFSAQHGTLHFVIIEQSALHQVDAAWATEQFANGAAFIGLDIHPTVLGKLINNETLVNSYPAGQVLASPAFSYAVLYLQGDPEAIQLLRAHNALYPPNNALEEELGIFVAQGEGGGYGSWEQRDLMRELNSVRRDMCDHGQLCLDK